MMVGPGLGLAVAQMVAGHINILLSQEEGCCPKCCGPCAALAYFRNDEMADEALSVWLEAWDLNWDWCTQDGHVRWADIEAKWTMEECHSE